MVGFFICLYDFQCDKCIVFSISIQSIEVLEKEMLNGQKLQGPPTAAEVNYMLKSKQMEDK